MIFLTIESFDPRYLLQILFNKYKLSPNSLSKISGIEEEIILNYANGIDDLSSSLDIRMDLDEIVGLLTLGMEDINENERVQAILQHLIEEFGISLETVGIYAKLELAEINNFLRDYTSIPIDKRYRLGIITLFLHYICK